MRSYTQQVFTAVRNEGGLLSPDLLPSLATDHSGMPGARGEDYHLVSGERINEVITRSWNRMRAAWDAFSKARLSLPKGDPGTSITRERLLLILFQELGYGRLAASASSEIDGKNYPISHMWRKAPIHLVGVGIDLDRRTAGIAGAARMSPHSMVQEYLNRSDEHLWAFLSNGLRLRMLRDSRSITRQAYIEFDLEAIFEGELFPDFVILWLLCHESRVEADRPDECWLERWSALGYEKGTRALDELRRAVEEAIAVLGSGFLAHPANTALRESLRNGALSVQDYYRELLRIVYRLIFLFVSEDRGLMHDPEASEESRKLYMTYYSTSRLRELAERLRGGRHPDAYEGFKVIVGILGNLGWPEIGLKPLGGYLWSKQATADLDDCQLSNNNFYSCIRSLAFTQRERMLWRVDFHNLGTEELGSIYESLLELHPAVNTGSASFSLRIGSGSERKTTGSYYTRPDLVQSLLDTALDPVLDRAAQDDDPERAILDLTVCDPACGSGHFLIAAAHRIARRLAGVRTGEEEPAPGPLRQALREVIAKCIYGVDVNPMSVELCKVSLWLEAMEPGKPLTFLDHHIQCGNSLIGASPGLIEGGIPDGAFTPIEGDDKKVAAAARKKNQPERIDKAQSLFDATGATWEDNVEVIRRAAALESLDDSTLDGVREIEKRYTELIMSDAYVQEKAIADAWCAAFVWPKVQIKESPYPLTQETINRLRGNPAEVPSWIVEAIDTYAAEYRFFHWHLMFPEVFKPTDDSVQGGFDVVLGNPPWERIKLQESEWFAQRDPDIAKAANAAARKRAIEALKKENPALHKSFLGARRQAEAQSLFVRSSGKYPLCGRGDVNTYAIFTELSRNLTGDRGATGLIVPTGIATDHTTRFFFGALIENNELVSLYDFRNITSDGGRFFPGIASAQGNRFCLLTLSPMYQELPRFLFRGTSIHDIEDEERSYTMSGEDITIVNPNTKTCPIFRTRRDAEITSDIYKRVSVLIAEGPPEKNPWQISFMRMFDMANDSGLFRTREQLEKDGLKLEGNRFIGQSKVYLPLYEAKMVHHYDHRWATYEGLETHDISVEEKRNPDFYVLPRYWVPKAEVAKRLADRWNNSWLFGWRDITSSLDYRTVIASILPYTAVGHTMPIFILNNKDVSVSLAFYANLSAFVLDYVSRQKIGGTHLTYSYLKQLPFLSSSIYAEACHWQACKGKTTIGWIVPRVLELAYTAFDFCSLARFAGYQAKPFIWNSERRLLIRAELDAGFFHLYKISRDDVEYIMDTFPIVKRHDEARYGEYRTKRLILEIYDKMKIAMDGGPPYESPLDPPPGQKA